MTRVDERALYDGQCRGSPVLLFLQCGIRRWLLPSLLKLPVEFGGAGVIELVERGLQFLSGVSGRAGERSHCERLFLEWIGGEIEVVAGAIELRVAREGELAHRQVGVLARGIPAVESLARRARFAA